MDSCNSEEVLAALREASAAFDKFLCDLDTFIRQEEEDIARYEAEFCCDNTETSK